jgi:hypothetical protein
MFIVNRLGILLVAVCATALKAQEKSSWDVIAANDQLDGFQVAPSSNPLNKALHDAAEYVVRFQPPGAAAQWTARRKQVDADFRRALGLSILPAHRSTRCAPQPIWRLRDGKRHLPAPTFRHRQRYRPKRPDAVCLR